MIRSRGQPLEPRPPTPLEPQGNGTRAAKVLLPAHTSHAFRYLGARDQWFNDEHADHQDGTNNYIHA
ncbi:hypothetical protein ACFWBI_22465 [Streptomyces sp. NPDC059982]|uniref:hypothetical protein n=1 Tax=unclassified Streptomyces TaxID=2593676 RepID=UPI00369E2509